MSEMIQLSKSIFGLIQMVVHDLSMIRGAKGCEKGVCDILNKRIGNDKVNVEKLLAVAPISFDKVTFSYDGKRSILNGVFYKFERNKKYNILNICFTI